MPLARTYFWITEKEFQTVVDNLQTSDFRRYRKEGYNTLAVLDGKGEAIGQWKLDIGTHWVELKLVKQKLSDDETKLILRGHAELCKVSGTHSWIRLSNEGSEKTWDQRKACTAEDFLSFLRTYGVIR